MKRILAQRAPEYHVRAFGSRVRLAAKDISDLDLVVMTDAPPRPTHGPMPPHPAGLTLAVSVYASAVLRGRRRRPGG